MYSPGMKRLATSFTLLTVACRAPMPERAEPTNTVAIEKDATAGDITKLDLVEGTPTTLPDGTIVNVKGVLYAHLSGSKNLSRCSLMLTRGSEHVEIGLERLHGDPTTKVSSSDGLGWRFTLVAADPYQRPSHATLDVQKLAP